MGQFLAMGLTHTLGASLSVAVTCACAKFNSQKR